MKQAQTGGRGFTLLEMLVVLVLLGLISAVSYPGVQSVYESYRAIAIQDNIKAQLVDYAVQARLGWQSIIIDSDDSSSSNKVVLKPLDSEEITLLEPIAINAKGVCMGGEVHVDLSSRVYRLSAAPPYCEIVEIHLNR